jgi:hypothetical protein
MAKAMAAPRSAPEMGGFGGPAGAPAGAPPAPGAPPPVQMSAPAAPKGGVMRSRKQEAARDVDGFAEEKVKAPGIDTAPYVARLSAIAEDLARAATAVNPNSAAQLPVARLAELLEDAKTVGLDELATKLAPIVDRLRGALVTGDLVTTLGEVATALRTLVSSGDGGGGTSPGQPRRKGWAFWR